MIFLTSVYMESTGGVENAFPFTLPLIRKMDEVQFTSDVTFFVGENGSGKSTLLEGIAAAIGSVAVGGTDIDRDATLAPARLLADRMRTSWSRNRTRRGFFLRSEDMFGFTNRIGREIVELEEMEREVGEGRTGYGKILAEAAVRGQRQALIERYGDDPDARSHGESFLNLFQKRVSPHGLYLLDEPETPLSPLRQLSLLALLKDAVAHECQFIIATHSPILMAFPNATIYFFEGESIRKVAYDEVEHVSLTRAFLNDPDSFLRHL